MYICTTPIEGYLTMDKQYAGTAEGNCITVICDDNKSRVIKDLYFKEVE